MRIPKVFISYSHDSAAHMDRVLSFADRLRADGIDTDLDQYETSPALGWPAWMVEQIERADFVCVVCTELYHNRVRGKEIPGVGLGAQWEGAIITQARYEAARNVKYVPVVFGPADVAHIPIFLRAATHYDVGSSDGYDALCRHLTDQPLTPKPALGSPRPMPPKQRQQRFEASQPDVLADLPVGNQSSSKSQPRVIETVEPTRKSPKRKHRLLWGLVALALASFFGAGIFLGLHLHSIERPTGQPQKPPTPVETAVRQPSKDVSPTKSKEGEPVADGVSNATKKTNAAPPGKASRARTSKGASPQAGGSSKASSPPTTAPPSNPGTASSAPSANTNAPPPNTNAAPANTNTSSMRTSAAEVITEATNAPPSTVNNASTNAPPPKIGTAPTTVLLRIFVENTETTEAQDVLSDVKTRCLSSAPFSLARDNGSEASLRYLGSPKPNELVFVLASTDGSQTWSYPVFKELVSRAWKLDTVQGAKDICTDFLMKKAPFMLKALERKRP